MRPIYFFPLIRFLVPVALVAQDPVNMAMRTVFWPAAATATATSIVSADHHIGWSVFSKQYYCVSNWNATGFAVDYSDGAGQSAVLIYRNGIPGFSWYHLCLSHDHQFKKVSGILQLRFSAIDLKDGPLAFRLGGNILTSWTLSQILLLQVNLFDFPGWVLPGTPVARGDPEMRMMLFYEPGRLIGMAAGFSLSQSHFGPLTGGIRVNLNDQATLTGLFEVLPFGVSLGVSFRINGFLFNGWLGHTNGLGVTPMVIFQRDP